MPPAAPSDTPLYLRIGRQNMAAEAFRAVRQENLAARGPESAAGPKDAPTTAQAAREVSLSFDDLIDALNPLQHLPGVAAIYRSVTGDEIGPLARLAGGFLYGGPIGFGVSLADTVLQEISGDDAAGHVMTALFGEDETAVQVAEAPPRAAPDPRPEPETRISAPSGPPGPHLALSPEGFAALLASFEDPGKDAAASDPAPAPHEPAPSGPAPAEPAPPSRPAATDTVAALSRALDKYEALNALELAPLATARNAF